MATHTCDYCGEEWRNPISAALCCDPITNDQPTDSPHRYELGYD